MPEIVLRGARKGAILGIMRRIYKRIQAGIGKPARVVFLLYSGLVLITYTCKFFFDLLTGPFVNVLLLAAMFLAWLFLALMMIIINPDKTGLKALVAGLILLIAGAFNPWDPSLQLYYWIYKSSLNELVYMLDANPGIVEITNFERYHKRLNNCHVSDDGALVDTNSVMSRLGGCIDGIDVKIEDVMAVRRLLDRCRLISYTRDDKYHIFIIDGFIDNEYGLLKLRENLYPMNPPGKSEPPPLNRSFGKYK